MDLALLVYGISLLHGLSTFFIGLILASVAGVGFFFIWYVSETEPRSYYSDAMNAERAENGSMCIMWIRRFIISGVITSFLMIFIPTEKTAYTMVGAYAAQKVAENDKVQAMSGKVLTIIEQKLDSYITEGVDELEAKTKVKRK